MGVYLLYFSTSVMIYCFPFNRQLSSYMLTYFLLYFVRYDTIQYIKHVNFYGRIVSSLDWKLFVRFEIIQVLFASLYSSSWKMVLSLLFIILYWFMILIECGANKGHCTTSLRKLYEWQARVLICNLRCTKGMSS